MERTMTPRGRVENMDKEKIKPKQNLVTSSKKQKKVATRADHAQGIAEC